MDEKYQMLRMSSWSVYLRKSYNLPYKAEDRKRRYHLEEMGDPYLDRPRPSHICRSILKARVKAESRRYE